MSSAATPGLPPVAGMAPVEPVAVVEPAHTTTASENTAVAAKDHDLSNDVDASHVLPVGNDVHPDHQAAALQDAPDHLVDAQVEKVKEAERELSGHEEQGTVVPGIENSKLWYLRRRFDTVSRRPFINISVPRLTRLHPRYSKFFMFCRLRPNSRLASRIFALQRCPLCLSRLISFVPIWSESTRPSESGRFTRRARR